MQAIQIEKYGGPEVLNVVDLPEPSVGSDQVLLRVDRAGVNYADIHLVENSYLERARLPFVPGTEVVGRTPEGRRLAALIPRAGYAQLAAVWHDLSFDVPDELSDDHALALLLQGVTASHLLRTSARLAPGESVVVQAAAGGVGSLAVQLARELGAGRVIATASSEHKRRIAAELGADEVVDSAPEGLTGRLRQANNGKGVDVVLEMVGGEVFDASFAALAPFGRVVTYGMASRTDRPVSISSLMRQSRSVVGFWLNHVVREPALLADTVAEVFGLAAEGRLRPLIGGDYPLTQAAAAHVDLRSRRSIGKLVLDPTR
ncbi:NADPH2:quinone reductase [Saccharopolyspora erythraea NRRL 2338]|uniref:Quinone oxidoreductase n=2 Tax=Saccharopolyspora erythraea TaxID=1836 RepID=A4FI68_SACEN|nr:NADPH:quinone oxidoreductase family protein [Saccharopolyspora erythraea]EQD86213.1 NADPH:quinone reductase [Saccharopolyspora erythraea D]PFG97423.1 NADPH2:quinone reductase [Saccharopolyspora erythraea NRRL 2338]QRK87603.1 NADPH:quinone oxidoreductase family protein [Saccharopolyspora erythraea]CAM03743.1 quinone oxidoreductase [Saccharopolyspora erythraea NRRL 2338]